MIHTIKFKHLKIFKQWQTLEIKPITIVMGKNNSGKSAVLKLLTLVEGALNSENHLPCQISNDGVVISDKYKNLIYGKSNRALEMEILQEKNENIDNDTLAIKMYVDNADTPILEYWNLNNELILEKIENNVYTNEIDSKSYECAFEGLRLSSYVDIDNPGRSTQKIIQPHTLHTDYIASIRAETKLDYRPSLYKGIKSNSDGRFLYGFLFNDYLTTEKRYFSKISNWLKMHFEGWALDIDVDSEPYHINLYQDYLSINITETGMGIGQALPLIIRAYQPCEKETVIIIEEPEAHLHAYAHAQLAQLFAESVQEDKNKKYVFETHSLNFILRMRRLVAEGKMKADDLAIYYVDYDEERNESSLKRIVVDDGGGVEWWPDGIFSETAIETKAIYNAQLNDLKNVDRNK